MDLRQEDLQEKRKRAQWIIYGANAYFYVQVATWASFMFVYRRFEDIQGFLRVVNFDAANKLLPAILLVFTILLFRC